MFTIKNNHDRFISIILLLILSITNNVLVHSLKMELIHRSAVSREFHGGRTTMETVKLLHRRDLLRRVAAIHRRRTTAVVSSAAMPMNSGSDYGVGEYFVHVKVGTPGQKFMLVADTGSDLTWMNCRYRCGKKCGTRKGRLSNNRRVFFGDRSSTFKTIPCHSDMCKIDLSNLFSLTRCPTPFTPCAYDYRYLEGSSALGFFANETISVGLTNGRKRQLKDVLIGCTQSILGQQSSFSGSDGVLGLGFGPHTFTRRVANEFGGRFSYCLVDHLSSKNVSNYIIFGRDKVEASLTSAMQRTSLVLGGAYGPLYGVKVSGISVGRALLNIPAKTWDVSLGGGTVVDSGTSLTFLSEPAYRPVTRALVKYTTKFKRLPDDGGPFEFCFNSTGFNLAAMPRLRVHFVGGAVLEPPVKSYVLDVAPETKCFGFILAAWPGTSTIGNILQQNHLWEFDLEQSRLGFAPSSCT